MYFAVICVALAFAVPVVFAQETETKVIDEVVAQVNDSVITLSRVKREAKSVVDSYVEQGKKRDEAQRLVDEKQGEMIANLINEELLMQKARDMGLDKDIEALVNQRMAEIMKEQNLKTVDDLYAAMEKSGLNPQELRENWRRQATREKVIQKEIQSRLYWSFGGKDVKDYFEKHKNKFTKPELVSLSEIYLNFAGKNESSVREKAKTIIDQLKGGANFEKIAKENDKGVVTQGAGKIEKLRVTDLPEKLLNAIKGLKAGEISSAVEADQIGIVILRVDAREQATDESVFDENAVRVAMMAERFPEEQKKYMAKLREDSYIKINDTYRPIVSPILFADERKDKPGN